MRFSPDPDLLESPRHRPWPGSVPRPAHRRPDLGDAPPGDAAAVVVGAGPAGLAVASALWHLGMPDVVVLDAGGRSCEQFFDRVDALGQRVLRSPYEHHPGVEGYRDCELLDHARLHWSLLTRTEREQVRMAQSGHRSVVPLDVFESFCGHVADVHGVGPRTWRSVVTGIDPGPDRVLVRTGSGTITTRAVVLCTGERRRDAPAGWWRHRPGSVRHWDERPSGARTGRLAVVGGGLTAAHVLAEGIDAGREVAWVIREPAERYQCADVNASFFRAEGRARFDGTTWEQRLALTAQHRRASIMLEFGPLLRAAEAGGQLTVHRGRRVSGVGEAGVELDGGDVVGAAEVVTCLGTVPEVGAGILPDDVVDARDGWPGLDPRTLAYERARRVFAVGAAAGMVLGPAARNIDGHRVAAARVASGVAALVRGAAPAAAEVVGTRA